MGLSGVKKRSKLSQDPNNTAWSRSTATFGHKILSKQGWKPGEYLGAENASHSDHYTAANASHIRVLLREENLGLGAQVGRGSAETFGLSMFSGLLGRLNGKSDGEVQKQQDAIRDVELRTYTGQKYGFMNFVSGGLLVGDKIEPPKSRTATSVGDGAVAGLSKKRKADHQDDDKEPAKVKRPRPEKTASKDTTAAADVKQEKTAKSKREQKEKKEKKEQRKAEKAAKLLESTSKEAKARIKEEKRARKEERRKRKEKVRKRTAAKEDGVEGSTQASAATSDTDGTVTPSTFSTYGGRQAVRQRYIHQKRMASMDPKALKEIFMIQANVAA